MATVADKNVAEVMKERRSVRKYKKGVNIPREKLEEILRLAITAPSSWNLQHWKFIVVEEEETKKRLFPIAYNQQQVLDASAVVIVLGDTEAYRNAEKVYGDAVRAGYMTEEVKSTLVNNVNQAYQNVKDFGVHEAIRNASLAAMQLMLAAKAQNIDSCPMGGFDPVALRKELNIPDRYIPIMMISLGYAAEPAHQTARFPLEQVVVHERFA
ncbi:nitroreductase family protein [Bacillaceae bacterium]